MTLGFFGLSRLKLELETETGNHAANRILNLRRDSNFLLTTLLWGNVAVNCLLTLLSESILSGVGAFLFSTFGITFFGEIIPQAYFSRKALKLGSLLYPLVRAIQVVLYPVAKPSAKILDLWLGPEGLTFFRESQLKLMLEKHMQEHSSEISRLEGMGAMNFLALDDVTVSEEGEIIDPKSIIILPAKNGTPIFPSIQRSPDDPFIQKVNESGKKWVILVGEDQKPRVVLDADEFLRDVLYGKGPVNPLRFCHRPIVVKTPDIKLGPVIRRLRVYAEHADDDVIDDDLILYWNDPKRIITGADLLGRLLRGIALRQDPERARRI